MYNRVKEIIDESIATKKQLLNDETLLEIIIKVVEEMVKAFKQDKKVLLCGNGGSAADAQHIAAELSGRFYLDRDPLFAEALHVNTSYLTAVANDYGYDEIFARLVKAKGRKGDILIAISTSGNSGNIIKSVELANELELITVGLTGESGGKMKDRCQYLINIPSTITPRIQEAHIMVGHIICELVEQRMFKN
ncbi:MAG: D-sedoheptulose 7-phosphate isomerase [Bacteroidetes bacterium]|nr:D-sedoheptulose 7-phosphate isomerase [Bacteroidota bacterium]